MAVRPRIRTAAPVQTVEADEDIVAAIINRGGAPAGLEIVSGGQQSGQGGGGDNQAAVPASVVPVAIEPEVSQPVALAPEPQPKPQPVGEAEKKFTLRLSASLLAEIERDAKGRPDRISVNTWLIGAALLRLGKA
ncbi:hypothetical protein WCLP8_5310003 [uncultured Gammaproteobacteria bacterium]